MFGTLPLDELVARARTLYTNARDTPEIATALLDPYAYTTTDFDDGLLLVTTLEQRIADQAREYGEQYLATETADEALDTLRARFVAHRRLARTAVPRGTARYAALGLVGDVSRDDEGLLTQTATFYQTLLDDPTLADGIRGLTPDAVTRARALVETARAAEDAQIKETGEAQRATARRDADAYTLRLHASELAIVAAVALADQPQLREVLGLLER